MHRIFFTTFIPGLSLIFVLVVIPALTILRYFKPVLFSTITLLFLCLAEQDRIPLTLHGLPEGSQNCKNKKQFW